jgi:hypothetical protein
LRKKAKSPVVFTVFLQLKIGVAYLRYGGSRTVIGSNDTDFGFFYAVIPFAGQNKKAIVRIFAWRE